MQVTTNLNALNAASALNVANTEAAQASQRISTQLRINSAKDDPGGLTVATKLKTQIGSLGKANENIHVGVGMLQTVDSAMTQITGFLTSMRDLAVRAASATASASDKDTFQALLGSYRDQINAISNTTSWNGYKLMDGSVASISIQTGINSGDTTSVSLSSTLTSSLGKSNGTAVTDVSAIDISSALTANPSAAMTVLDKAIADMSTKQAAVGAYQNILDSRTTLNSALVTVNSSAYGKIMNADLAAETANLAAAQIKQNAASAMVTQSSQMNKEVVGYLLKGLMN
jgi:flagellin